MQTVTSLDTVVADLVERLTSEGLIGMGAAARLYGSGRQDRGTHPSTPSRHATSGVTLPDGTHLVLESVVIAGRRMTSKAAVLRFIRAQQPSTSAPPASPIPPSPTQRRRASESAAAKAAALLA